MKKLFILSMALVLCTITAWTQNQVAVLNHEGKINVYYGSGALSSAVSAARKGDVINLSAGTFSGCTINKAVTIRGAGMFADTETQTGSTNISSAITLQPGIHSDTEYHLSFEGINFSTVFTLPGANVYYINFIKCKVPITNVNSTSSLYYLYNCNFYACHVVATSLTTYYHNLARPTFINCYVQLLPYIPNSTYRNCTINWTYTTTSGSSTAWGIPETADFENCLMLGYYHSFNGTAMNCLYVNKSGSTLNPFSAQTNETNYTASGYGVFEDFAGDYLWNANFHLTPANERKYVGTDGTTVGMYGGSMPFTMVVSNPRIKKCEVAPKTTTDGKLNVNIEVLEGE